jgi:hypothetical protein
MNFKERLKIVMSGGLYLFEAKFPLLKFQSLITDLSPEIFQQNEDLFLNGQKIAFLAAFNELVKMFGQKRPNIVQIFKVVSEHVQAIINDISQDGVAKIPTPQESQMLIKEVSQIIFNDWEEMLLYADL